MAPFHQTQVLELPVGAMDGVGIDGHLLDHLPHRGEAVAGGQVAEPDGPVDLVDELAVGGHAGGGIQPEQQERLATNHTSVLIH